MRLFEANVEMAVLFSTQEPPPFPSEGAGRNAITGGIPNSSAR